MVVDNGHGFTGHEEITSKLGVDVYFAHLYYSWKRGLSENTNGLIRQCFPKKTYLLRDFR
jgi:IS30 family transposase